MNSKEVLDYVKEVRLTNSLVVMSPFGISHFLPVLCILHIGSPVYCHTCYQFYVFCTYIGSPDQRSPVVVSPGDPHQLLIPWWWAALLPCAIHIFIPGFLGPRGPLVLPSVGPSRPVRPVCKKNLDHLYTGIYAL